MRILRVMSISIKTLATALSAVLALSITAPAQSFDYPADSPTLFNRGTQQAKLPAVQTPSPTGSAWPKINPKHGVVPNTSAKPSVFSKLFSRKNKSAQPVFDSGLQNTAATNISTYSTGESVYLDPYAKNILNRHQTQANHASGYEPSNQKNQVQRVNFAQSGDSRPHSIFERVDEQDSSTTEPTLGNVVTPPAPANFTPTATTRLEKQTKPIVPEPVAKVAQRVSLPDNAFKQEFEKAYRYINQSAPQDKNRATRVAKADDASRVLTLDDFSVRSSELDAPGDFSPNTPLQIEKPPFIRPEPSEQSPNALAPSFNPSQPSGDFDTFSTAPVTEITISGPAKTSERSLFEALKANDIKGDFEDSLGDINQWQPPEPSRSNAPPQPHTTSISKEALDAELAELSKPLMQPETPDAAPQAPVTDAETIVSPPSFSPHDQSLIWWKQQVIQPLHPDNQAMPIDSNGLVFAALRNSPRIAAVSKNPLIRELQVVEANAEFDPVRFVRSQFQDRVDPVGNTLTINDGLTEQFLRENIWTGEAGIRRKLRTGANFTVSQQLGFHNSNSNNFFPQDQGTATLALNVTQPLLRGRGRAFNQAQILIAQSSGGVAWEVFQRELQEELEGVAGAYWQLYLQRSIYLQRKRNVERGLVILDRLNGRRELDSLPAQIARAKSSVQTRRTELANAFRNVRNAETEIRRRVADRNWMASQKLELLPQELPTVQNTGWQLDQVVKTALNHRPEIRESMRRIKIAGVQRDVSENELLPELSFLVGTYVSALQGDSDVLGAFDEQFNSTPGYSFGLEYELPRLNRAARSRFQQRHLQFKRLQNELEEVIQNVIAESQIALRRVTSAIETLAAAEEAIVAAKADLDQHETRWESFALVEGDIAEGVTPTTTLDQLLDSQERLSQAEIVYAQAEQELKISELALQRSMGTLLMHQEVSYDRHVVGDTPVVNIHKNGGGPTPIQSEVIHPYREQSTEVITHDQSVIVE